MTGKKDEKVTLTKQIITPALASEWLKHNVKNRPLRQGHVDLLTKVILGDQWVVDGNPIRFNDRGDVIDGQHRLSAIVRSKRSVESLVCRGLKEEAQNAIDVGRSRSHADVLTLKGVESARKKLAPARIIERWERGDSASTSRKGTTLGELEWVLDKFGSDIDRAVNGITYTIDPGIRSGAASTFAAFAYARVINPVVVDELMVKVRRGMGISPGDPAHTIRSFISKLQSMRASSTIRLEAAHRILRGVEAGLDGRELYVLKLDSHVVDRIRDRREIAESVGVVRRRTTARRS